MIKNTYPFTKDLCDIYGTYNIIEEVKKTINREFEEVDKLSIYTWDNINNLENKTYTEEEMKIVYKCHHNQIGIIKVYGKRKV